jgi:NADH dehydrogenase [ubiquinone] 1 alpha subcomplex assembly factor 5
MVPSGMTESILGDVRARAMLQLFALARALTSPNIDSVMPEGTITPPLSNKISKLTCVESVWQCLQVWNYIALDVNLLVKLLVLVAVEQRVRRLSNKISKLTCVETSHALLHRDENEQFNKEIDIQRYCVHLFQECGQVVDPVDRE